MAHGGKRSGSGRKKGVPNKITTSMREMVMQAFNDVGGVKAFAEWGKKQENRKDFYMITARLIPVEMTGANGAPLPTVVINAPNGGPEP